MDFHKSDNSIIRIQKSEYSGKKFYDFRIFFLNNDNVWKPTPKGFTVSLDSIEQFLEELNEFFKIENKTEKS